MVVALALGGGGGGEEADDGGNGGGEIHLGIESRTCDTTDVEFWVPGHQI